ncbi:MAG: ATP phosphoribosyltransferase [Firmicutes bacterium ADurb.Bin300]|nr:MAG: ATP phosphoribosyltransferase [Firmicutes bacterium ADurb.Bin300]
MSELLNIALPKGRLGEKSYAQFDKIGYSCPEVLENNRKLIFENDDLGVRYFWVKPSDVGKYVERGAADIGVVGKDILLEYRPDVYELFDLGMGKCRMVVAGFAGSNKITKRALRVATSFPNIARDYYSKQSREIDIIKLSGSVEIAPLLKMADVIVDIVETGTTLKENNLEALEDIVEISARLIANKVSFKFKNKKIDEIISKLKSGV